MIYIIAGVSGVGKTTIGQALARELELEFLDADDFHPQSNITKMESGQPLTDTDRKPWLDLLNHKLRSDMDKGIVLACSALKESYRQLLSKELQGQLKWIFLSGDFDLIKKRMEKRQHFMPSALLQSQYDALEIPEYGIEIDVVNSPVDIIQQIIEKTQMKGKAEIGLIGLGVMGKSLSRNIAQKGFEISVYNRHVDGIEVDIAKQFVAAHEELNEGSDYDQMPEFIASLSIPRKVFLMVSAGAAVDHIIEELCPLLAPGDIIIDGGNSHYKDTQRRYQYLAEMGIGYIGTGVSGGEKGALEGPSIMPGGSAAAYREVQNILAAIAAKDAGQSACCAFIGKGGAGHFVKMVHNGIEYAEMQLIAEVYGILRFGLGKEPLEISNIFKSWNQGDCRSYLLEITADILTRKEEDTYLLDLILDKAGNKGTGSWTTIAACELGVAIPTITAALFARYQSAHYDDRQNAAELFSQSLQVLEIDIEAELKPAYQQARIINHHQGFDLIKKASEQYGWDINMGELARIWTNGCIIRSILMEDISASDIENTPLLLQAKRRDELAKNKVALNGIISKVVNTSISISCLTSAVAYFNGFIEKRSLANVIQAQRDYFGAHTYERVDAPRGQKFHTKWE